MANRKIVALSLTILLSIHVFMLAWEAYVDSPTFKEPAQVAAGIFHWQFVRFDIAQANPPLVRIVAAIPVLIAGAATDWYSFDNWPGSRPEFSLGEYFLAANGERSQWLFCWARWACIPFSLIGALVCFYWARELYGVGAGFLSATLWCFCPQILGHGHLVTSDAAAAALALAAAFAFWNWLRRPTWRTTFVAAFALGIAQLTKLTLLALFPLWPILWAFCRSLQRGESVRPNWTRELRMLSALLLIAVYIINLAYCFEGTGTRLGDFHFVSEILKNDESAVHDNRFSESAWMAMPVPLPKNYILGIDWEIRELEPGYNLSYLGGQLRAGGWWYFYLYALAVIVPTGTLLLLCMASCTGLWSRTPAKLHDEILLLGPALLIIGFVSSQTGFTLHARYILPAYGFAFVWIGRIVGAIKTSRVLILLVGFMLEWSVLSSIWVFPHSLSYFNEIAGGPLGGPRHLIHSNIDWGQDVFALKEWFSHHPEARPLKLAYFGHYDPHRFGLEYIPVDNFLFEQAGGRIAPGWYAISTNFVRGFPFFTYNGGGSRIDLQQDALTGFQEYSPSATAGYSIYIYHVPE